MLSYWNIVTIQPNFQSASYLFIDMPRILAGLVILLFTGVGEAQSGFGTSSMPPTVLTLQMIIDYAVDEQWKQLVLFDCIGADGSSVLYLSFLLL